MSLFLEAQKKKQERAQVIAEARAIHEKAVAEKRNLSAEERGKYDELFAKAQEINDTAERLYKQDQLDRELSDTRDTPPAQGTETRDGDPKAIERRAAFGKYLTTGQGAEYRALQQDVATQAGYLVAPETFVAEIIKGVDDTVFIRKEARKFSTSGSQSLGAVKRTARTSTFAMGTELSAPTADSTMALGKRELKPQPARGGILVSKTLLRNAPQADTLVRDEITYELGVFEEGKFLTGSGANEPLGIFVASNDGISTARDVSTGNTTTELRFDGLIRAKYALKEAYWNAAKWMFHRDGMAQISLLKDGEGRYIWRESVRVGEPDTVLNRPVHMSENCPNTFTTAQYVGMFGDFSKYWIADDLRMEIQVLYELYALTNQAYYLVAFEFDGAPVLEEAFVRVKLA